MTAFIDDLKISRGLTRVYGTMFSGLLLTAGVAGFVHANPTLQALLTTGILGMIFLFLPLVVVIGMLFLTSRLSIGGLRTAFFTYAGLNGISLSILLTLYPNGVILSAFISTVALFAALSIYGFTTGRSLENIGSFCFMALIGIIIAGLVNMYFRNPMASMLISMATVVIFLGLVAYDTQQIKDNLADDDEKGVVLGALALYLDFLNIFLSLVQLLGGNKDD